MQLSRNYLANKKILIAGIQGSGKTYLARAISRLFPTLVYTPHLDEWRNEKVLAVKTNDFINEFPSWCEFFKVSKLKLLIADEADLLFRHHFDVSPSVKDLVINHRHYGKTLCFITRRIQDIPAKLYGQFEILCLFTIESPQAIDLLNKYYPNLGEMVKQIPYGSHQFLLKHIGRPPELVMV
jgi:chromosomal replication initiation ATPase DnaA